VKYLVAGGAGFLGSHLVKELLDGGNDVIVVDNLCTGNMCNIQEHFKNDKFSFWCMDIRDLDVRQFNLRLDGIFNMACPASPLHYFRIPVETLMTSVQGTYNLLRIADEHGARILHTSTSEVYGDPLVHPQTEEYWGNVNPYGMRSCYDEGKRAAEALMHDFRDNYGTDTRVVRIFNTYGPNMDVDDGRVVSNFIVQALRGVPITICGDGTQTRSFCYVSDLIRGIWAVFDSDVHSPLNIGNPVEFTMNELAEIVIHKTNSKSIIKYVELPKDDPKQRKPDISRVTTHTGWSPSIQLEQGIELSIPYFEEALKRK